MFSGSVGSTVGNGKRVGVTVTVRLDGMCVAIAVIDPCHFVGIAPRGARP